MGKKSQAKNPQGRTPNLPGLKDLGKVARVLLRPNAKPVVLDAETKVRFEFLLRTSLEISALNPLSFIDYLEVAERFNVCENTVRAWIADKTRRRPFPAPIGHADDGRLVVFPEMLIDLFIASIIVDGYGLNDSLFFEFDALSEQINKRIGRGGLGLRDVRLTTAGPAGASFKERPVPVEGVEELVTGDPNRSPADRRTFGALADPTFAASPAVGNGESCEYPAAQTESVTGHWVSNHRIVEFKTRPLIEELRTAH